ncbi:MAG: glycosyltransferase [Nitrospirae bacterium]|nr:glycosyltransferase [Nitrospirota bacterium]
MLKLPRISIVTLSYNQVAFLEETILSVLDQNYPFLEYVIIDGGSTDGSVDVINKYEKHLLYWVSEKDKGQSNAINKGFDRCSGDILNWLNSDDRLTPNALASVAAAVRAAPDAGVWAGCCNIVDAAGNLLETNVPRGLVRNKLASWGFEGHLFQPACYFSRKAWEKYGPLDEELHFCFDLDFYLKVVTDYEFYGVGKIWAEATFHKDAKTQKHMDQMKEEISVVQRRHGFERLVSGNGPSREEIIYGFLRPGLLRAAAVKLYKFGLRNYYNARLKLKGMKLS